MKKPPSIPAERMKMREPHIVPLSRQALVLLSDLRKLNGDKPYVIYSVQGRWPISNNTMLFALYRMGYKSRMTGHGFRGLAATVLREIGYSRDVVDPVTGRLMPAKPKDRSLPLFDGQNCSSPGRPI